MRKICMLKALSQSRAHRVVDALFREIIAELEYAVLLSVGAHTHCWRARDAASSPHTRLRPQACIWYWDRTSPFMCAMNCIRPGAAAGDEKPRIIRTSALECNDCSIVKAHKAKPLNISDMYALSMRSAIQWRRPARTNFHACLPPIRTLRRPHVHRHAHQIKQPATMQRNGANSESNSEMS